MNGSRTLLDSPCHSCGAGADFNLERIIHLSSHAVTRTDLALLLPVNLLPNFTVELAHPLLHCAFKSAIARLLRGQEASQANPSLRGRAGTILDLVAVFGGGGF